MDSNRAIFGSTEVYGVFGYPISHSFSPAIQNAAFRFFRMDAIYLPFPVEAPELRSAVHGAKSLGMKGFNVTTPLKMMILRYLDEVETGAAAIGSINTVKNEDRKLVGFNTDGVGALDAIKEAEGSVGGQRVLLFGAGGAARAIAFALARQACSIKIINRTMPKARSLAKELQVKFGARVETAPISSRVVRESVDKADIILNASSMGMDGKNPLPIERGWIRRSHLVFDLVYRPLETKLLRDAAAAGANTINGLEMLVNQGARSFRIWTGKKAPIRQMRRAIPELNVQHAGSR